MLGKGGKGVRMGTDPRAPTAMDVWGPLNEPVYRMVGTRTEHWTDELVERMDARNKERMECLPPVWQEHVVRTYGTRPGQVVRDVDKHVASTITGVRRLLYAGMTEDEAVRLQDVAAMGGRISYLPCTQYEQRRTCRYGGSCTHPHLDH